MKKLSFYTGMILVLLLVSGVSCSAAASKYAAKVNGVPIKNSTLDSTLNNFIENRKMMGFDVKQLDRDKLRNDMLEQLIAIELLYKESMKADLGDLTKKIDQQFESIKKGFGSEKEFKKILKKRGTNLKEFKDNVKKGVYIEAFLDKNVYNDIKVTESEKETEYEKNKNKLNVPEQIKARHILIRVAKDATKEERDAAKAKIKALRERAIAGEDFAKLAKENSDDASASQGGDLGYFARNNTVQPFEKAAFSLKKGEISDVVETEFGYHIIKLIDKKPARTLSYSEVKDQIEKVLLSQHQREKLNSFIDGLKKDAKIEIY